MADVLQGRNFNIYFTLNGYSYPAAHATDGKITFSSDVQETTTKNSLRAKTYNYLGKYTWTLELEGITNFIDVANVAVFQQAIMQSNKLSIIFTDLKNIEWAGTVLITDTDLDSPVKSVSTFSNKMQGDGELVLTDSYVSPPAPGSSVSIIDQLGEVLAIVPAPGVYNVLRFDTIDCGHAVQSLPLIIMQAS